MLSRAVLPLERKAASSLSMGARALSVRPGQPYNLTRYDRGPSGIVVPSAITNAEAEKMGRLLEDLPSDRLEKRPVPSNADDYITQRAQYRKNMALYRKKFANEWTNRREHEKQAAAAIHEKIVAEKEEAEAIRAVTRKAGLLKHEEFVSQSQAARAAAREISVLRESRRQNAMKGLRRRWLKALEEDAKNWIKEDEVTTKISPDLFAMKYSWQWEEWFKAKELKRQLREEARRTKRAGEPLKEISLPAEAAAFDSDWNSDGENDNTPALFGIRAADAEAQLDSSEKVGMALSVAKKIARERGKYFLAPGYGPDGRPFSEGGLDATDKDSVNLAELYFGGNVEDIVADYEKFVSNSFPDMDLQPGQLDNGERALENAYIDLCVATSNMEALYYALVRKKSRLVREGHKEALSALEEAWGPWLNEIEINSGLKLDDSTSAAIDLEFADTTDNVPNSTLDGSKAAGMDIDDRNLPSRK